MAVHQVDIRLPKRGTYAMANGNATWYYAGRLRALRRKTNGTADASTRLRRDNLCKLQEAGAGDPRAAQERLVILKAMILLDTTEEAIILAEELVRSRSLPEKAADDALHIAIAAHQKIPYLLTWNCRHMANATMRPAIEAVCASKGYKVPIICTPEELKKVIS